MANFFVDAPRGSVLAVARAVMDWKKNSTLFEVKNDRKLPNVSWY